MLPIKRYIKDPNLIATALLLRYGNFIPDALYLRLLYFFTLGRRLKLKDPRRFTEKIQWLKLYYRKPEFSSLVDKFIAKRIVSNIIGEKYIIPTITCWDAPSDVNLDELPEKFVLKTTHGGGSTGVIICKDKQTFDLENAIDRLKESMKQDIYPSLREWPYRNVPKKIIAEQYMEDENEPELTDYKFYCFNGSPKFCQVISNRHTKETIDFYDINWIRQDFTGLTFKCVNSEVLKPRPQRLYEMIEISKKLSRDMPFLRVDLYVINNQVYFGEVTFYPASGLGVFNPDNWDFILGELIKLPQAAK